MKLLKDIIRVIQLDRNKGFDTDEKFVFNNFSSMFFKYTL